MELDLGQIVPDPAKTIRGGALSSLASEPLLQRFHAELLAAATALSIPLDVPFGRLSPDALAKLLEGVPESGFTGLKGFFEAPRAPSAPAAGAAVLEPRAPAARVPGLQRARGCGPRRWPSRSTGTTSPRCRP